MKVKLKLSHKMSIIVCSLLLFELAFVGLVWGALKNAEEEIQEETRIRTVIMHITHLMNLMQDTTVSLMRACFKHEDAPTAIITQLEDELDSLKTMLADHPDELSDIRNLEATCNNGIPLLQKAKDTYDTNVDAHKDYLLELKAISDRATLQVHGILEAYRRKEDESLRNAAKHRADMQMLLLCGFFVNIATAAGIIVVVSRTITDKLNILQQNSMHLAIGKPLLPPIRGKDEFADVDRAFHEMADALQEAKAKERAVIDNAVDVICSIDSDGRFTAVSPASFTVWGYSPDELIGRRFTDMMPPEDREGAREKLAEIIKTQAKVQIENRVVHKMGHVVDVLLSAYWSHREKSLFCVAHDHTDRKRAEMLLKASEERIRQVIYHLPTGVITIAPDGNIESINPRTEEIFGYTAQELIGKNLWLLFQATANRDDFLDRLQANAMGRIKEMNAQRKSEEIFPVEISLNRFQSSSGEHFLVHVQDITERRAVEKLKREFVAMISHDLRTPLMSVEFSLSLLSAGACGDLPERAQENVADAENNISYVMQLINGLLDVEKLSSGKLEMRFAEMDMAEVFDRCLDTVRPLAEKRNIKLDVPLNSLPLYGDENRLVQVMVNLISNALKFSPGGTTISVTALEHDDDVVVQVADQGAGIPASQKEKIFQRFERTESAKKVDGVGLGLSICKVIIEQHSGEMGVESEEGKGSTFWFRIPKHATAALKPPVTAL
jgi:PAS domain S-box-containing protein